MTSSKWLIAALLLILEIANLLKKKSHGRIGIGEGVGCRIFVVLGGGGG